MSPASKAQQKAVAKYMKANYDELKVRLPKGAKERIVEAATVTGQSTNGFIRSSLNKAVQDATGKPMEVTPGDREDAE